ncbi:unnamed protein product [Pleuronectes platessa]|uniref:Uncharacterized protein n=1 Tax=Pleuronectes platessa TaxID=8262 RepID=A0A9N7VMI4_PLEPL|nr:unnamed protein product [Pleuronectes platessa]
MFQMLTQTVLNGRCPKTLEIHTAHPHAFKHTHTIAALFTPPRSHPPEYAHSVELYSIILHFLSKTSGNFPLFPHALVSIRLSFLARARRNLGEGGGGGGGGGGEEGRRTGVEGRVPAQERKGGEESIGYIMTKMGFASCAKQSDL